MPVRRIVIDHLAIGVADLARSRAFYAQALAPLGFVELSEGKDGRDVAFGPAGLDDFAISLAYPVGAPIHVAFAADSPQQVDEFYAAAIAAGGRDNGAPAFVPSTRRATTGPSSSTPTAITWRPFTTPARTAFSAFGTPEHRVAHRLALHAPAA